METYVRTLGRVKNSDLVNNFDKIVDKYRTMAISMGYSGDLKFERDGCFITIFVEV